MADKKMIDYLNLILKNELTAINQYFLHAKIMANMGLSKIAAITRQESIDEMKHAENLINRVLYLKAIPDVKDCGKVRIGKTLKEMIEIDIDTEKKALKDLKDAITYGDNIGDFGSTEILNAILVDEEQHLLFLETQLNLIETIGINPYIQSQIA